MKSNLEIKREEQGHGARQVKFTVSDIEGMAESSNNGAIIAEESSRLWIHWLFTLEGRSMWIHKSHGILTMGNGMFYHDHDILYDFLNSYTYLNSLGHFKKSWIEPNVFGTTKHSVVSTL